MAKKDFYEVLGVNRDASAVTSASEALEQEWHKAAAALYQQQGATPGADAQASEPAPDPAKKGKGGDGAVDADFEVVN